MLKAIIGIEIHVHLKSKTKAFSRSLNSFDSLPNQNLSLIDLAYPGTLPRLNKKVVEMALKAALAFNCSINKEMTFERKGYFYPDLPKGYQITQERTPIGYNGYLLIEVDNQPKKIALSRLHIEEDTAKSLHEQKGTKLDFNRAGVPLIEIVTKPVLESAKEAMAYVEKVQETLLYLGISDVKIEEGSMRCDANISLSKEGKPGPKVEIKNIGSISNVGNSILYEIKRQTALLEKGQKIIQETRRYDDKTNTTITMRVKEATSDYCYLPEIDLPLVKLTDDYLEEVKAKLPPLPDEIREKYAKLGLNQNNIKTIVGNYQLFLFFEKVINMINPVMGANLLTGDILSYLKEKELTINEVKLTPDNFKELVEVYEKKELSSKQIKKVIPLLLKEGGAVSKLVTKLGLKQINDESLIIDIIKTILKNNPKSVKDYKNGQERVLKFLMGQIMKASRGQVNPAKASTLLVQELKKT